MKKYAQYMDFLNEIKHHDSVYRAIIWYLNDWIHRNIAGEELTITVNKVDDRYYISLVKEYKTWTWNEFIGLYEENGNFIFEKTTFSKDKADGSEWYPSLAPVSLSIPVKSSGYRVFAKFIKEYYETHKA